METKIKVESSEFEELFECRVQKMNATAEGKSSIEVREYKPEPLFANAKPPFYLNQREKPVHRAMLELAAKGYDVKEIAAIVGKTPVCVNNILRQPMLQQTLADKVHEIHGVDEQVVEIIKEGTLKAVKKLLESVEKVEVSNVKDLVQLADRFLDRRYGKATQRIQVGQGVDLDKLTDADLGSIAVGETSGTATSEKS